MTYDLLIFTNNPEAYAPIRIKQELEKRNRSCMIIKYGDEIPDAKHIFFRDFGESGKQKDLIQKLNSPKVINFESFKNWPTLDKILQYQEFKKAGIPVVETSSTYTNLKFPFIAKVSDSSQGRGVRKIISKEDLQDFIKDNFGKSILYQPFLTVGSDLRVIVLDGKVLGAMKRTAQKGEYLTNFSRGGSVVSYNIESDREASDIAEKVARQFKLDYCGIDLMQNGEGKWKVLEVNRACQFKGFELATGINVAIEIVEFLKL